MNIHVYNLTNKRIGQDRGLRCLWNCTFVMKFERIIYVNVAVLTRWLGLALPQGRVPSKGTMTWTHSFTILHITNN